MSEAMIEERLSTIEKHASKWPDKWKANALDEACKEIRRLRKEHAEYLEWKAKVEEQCEMVYSKPRPEIGDTCLECRLVIKDHWHAMGSLSSRKPNECIFALQEQNAALKKALAVMKEMHAKPRMGLKGACVICRAIAEAEEVCGE